MARRDDRPELLWAITEAAEVAGLDTQNFSENNNAMDEGKISTTRPSQSLPITKDATRKKEASAVEEITVTQDSSISSNCRAHTAAFVEKRLDLRRASPRLEHGLWFDTYRYMRIDSPPLDIVPYLGKGRSTFPGRLFWACGEHMLDLCRTIESHEHVNPRVAREATQRIWNMVHHSPPLHNVRYIRALAEARIEYRDRGYIEGNNPAGEVDSAQNLQNLVVADYESRGEDKTVWLSPEDVEAHLRKRMSGESYKNFQYVLQLWDSNQDQCRCPLTDLVQSLIQNLARSCTCFGDGPRWRADRISAILSGSIQSVVN